MVVYKLIYVSKKGPWYFGLIARLLMDEAWTQTSWMMTLIRRMEQSFRKPEKDCGNTSASGIELPQSPAKPSIYNISIA